MASLFDQAPLYGYKPNASIRDLMLMQGETRARAAEQAGQNWARTLEGIGGAVAGGIQAYGAQKEEKKKQEGLKVRDAAGLQVAQTWDGKDPQALYQSLAKIGGPDYAEKYGKTVMAFHAKPSEDAKTELSNMYIAAKGVSELEDPMLAEAGWDAFKNRYGGAAVDRLGVPAQLLEGPWTPEHKKGLEGFLKPVAATLGIKEDKPADEDATVVVGGNLVNRKTGKVVFAEPPKVEKSLQQIEAEHAAMARGTASVRPAQAPGSSDDNDEEQQIADAIIRGEQPPDLKALYKAGKGVRAKLAKAKFPLAEAQSDWQATQRHVATMNGPAQTRMAQAIETSSHALDKIDDLAREWDAGKFPLLNKGQLAAARSGVLGAKAQSIANQLEAQITDVTSELGQVYMGGNSPTDHALGLAQKNLAADWSRDTLLDMTKLARTNLQIRANSMRNSQPMGTGDNRYAPASPAPAAGGRTVVRMGKTKDGKVAIQYSDGTTEEQ